MANEVQKELLPPFLRLREVKRSTGLSKTSIYDEMKKGKFPQNFSLSDRSVAWLESEVEEWKANRLRQRKNPESIATLPYN